MECGAIAVAAVMRQQHSDRRRYVKQIFTACTWWAAVNRLGWPPVLEVLGSGRVMKRWLVACIALGVGGAVTAALLIVTNPSRNTVAVYVAAKDVPAGAVLGADSLVLAQVQSVADPAMVFGRHDGATLAALHATHDLESGQLIQHSDVAAATSVSDGRLVFVPLKDVPPVSPGSKVDLYFVDSGPGGATVQPFATGVEVRGAVSGGLVVVVSSPEAAAFVYAATNMQLVAAVAEPGAAPAAAVAVATRDQAVEIAGRP